ncbi:MAG: 3-phosphoshikimate 1-carboxyvinyltransferase [Defluviitaleaceae bacterium]|nr:3-phosphoshikimate 1-carboxyvinyltransferase [Defluviitaleaceae bacterium]
MTREVDKFPHGVIQMPPSKSVSHRALICAGLAEGRSVLRGLSESEDINATIACMSALGARFSAESGEMSAEGCFPKPDGRVLDCGDSGSTLRFLIPIAALTGEDILFAGTGRLSVLERPLGPYREAFARRGVTLEADGGRLRLSGGLKPGIFPLDGKVSSQFVSGLLFALPLLDGDSAVRLTSALESASYVDLTLDALEKFGITVENREYKEFLVKGGQKYRPAEYRAEADFSQAAFFLAAGALGADCECAGLDKASRQGDRQFLDILRQCGIELIERENGNIKAVPGKTRGVTVDMSDIPDLAPPLAALLCFCEGTSELVNAGRLRFKECDRLAALAGELGKLGAKIEEKPDGIVITGVKSLKGGEAGSRNDHRIAMALAVAAIRADGPVYVEGSECVSKSYPGFWEEYSRS